MAYPPTPEQQAAIDAFRTGTDMVIQAGAGAGKALRYDQPVLTPAGWRAIGDLNPGDLVTGSNGAPATVLGVYPQGVRDLFEVVASDGTSVIADADHLWLTTTTKDRDRHQPAKVRTTAEIAATLRLKSGRINHYLPMLSRPAQMPEAALPLDPYLLGVLLGDGGLTHGSPMLSTPDPEILAAVEALLPAGVRAIRVGSTINYRLSGEGATVAGRRGMVNPLTDILREIGVYGSGSASKAIPQSYLYASARQRHALLQGLLDTDGSAAKTAAEFSTASKVLADQVVWLVQSLGGITKVNPREVWHTYKGERRAGLTSYRMVIALPEGIAPFRLPRKRDAVTARTHYPIYRQIVDVRPVPAAEAVCISVDAADKLYLTAGCIPTHNTSTLKLLAQSAPHRKGMYIAYNKAIATDAQRSFPGSVSCSTAHSLAYQAIGKQYRDRLSGARMPAYRVAQALGIYEPLALGTDVPTLLPKHVARIVMDTVARFCRTADPELTPYHMPHQIGFDAPAAHRALQREIHPYAVRVWEDLQRVKGGVFPYTHDVYLKMWQLTRPQLAADYVLLDEAQDANPVIASIVGNQGHAQRIAVGDSAQAIYEFTGAIDAMDKWPGARLALSKSFRFGAAVAEEANRWLDALDAPLRITGHDPIPSIIAPLENADAILCRSNGGAMREVIARLNNGRRVALVGGGKQVSQLAYAAKDLKEGKRTEHPELAAFANWNEVQEYVDLDSSGSDLAAFVKLIDTYGPGTIISAVARLSDERDADVIVSTAHKAKGREWNRVQIGGDFRAPRLREDGTQERAQPAELRLAYVAVTRAKRELDRGSLAWLDTYEPRDALALAAA